MSRLKGIRQRAEVAHGEKFPGSGVREADEVGSAEAGLEGGLVDEFFSAVEMPWGIHVGARVGVEVIHTRVPAASFSGFNRLQGNPGHLLSDGAGEIDEHGEGV